MKRKVVVIGIGAGNPEHVTVQAIKALNQASVLFIPNKGAEKAGLASLRREICERYIDGNDYRLVEFATPERDKPTSSYPQSIERWRDAVERVYRRLLLEELGEEECGAFLVWGDPSLYDGTLRILDSIRASENLELELDVVPGISSVQALAARHRIALHRIGESIAITTGRRLAERFPEDAESVVVMLDAQTAFKSVDQGLDIHWGAYVGTPDEILVSGKLRDVGEEIARVRSAARERHGWIMDTYLLTGPSDGDDG